MAMTSDKNQPIQKPDPAPRNQPTHQHLGPGLQDATHKSDEDPRNPNDERSDQRDADAQNRGQQKPAEIVGQGPSGEPIQKNPNTGATPQKPDFG